jgi:hypothetical protein
MNADLTTNRGMDRFANAWHCRPPVLHSTDSEHSVRLLRFVAEQVRGPQELILKCFERSQNASNREGFPAAGTTRLRFCSRASLLGHFGSIKRGANRELVRP